MVDSTDGGADYASTDEPVAVTGTVPQQVEREAAGTQSIAIECTRCGTLCTATLHVGLQLVTDPDGAHATVTSTLVDLAGCEHAEEFLTAYRGE